MVRAIVEKSEGRIFYGTRSAGYVLDFPSEDTVNEFAKSLESELVLVNKRFHRDDGFSLVNDNGTIGINSERWAGKETELQQALKKTSNIQIEINYKIIANLVSRFLDEEANRDRFFEIYSYGIPNKIVPCDVSFLYELGEKYGTLRRGEDFNIRIKNYRKIADTNLSPRKVTEKTREIAKNYKPRFN